MMKNRHIMRLVVLTAIGLLGVVLFVAMLGTATASEPHAHSDGVVGPTGDTQQRPDR